ncbi:MAG: CHAT domain-containing protein, partial [Caldilineaceae bacterium]|nr:CHAT domain-containing protein [Caldilineaceae bacterium]
PKRTMRWLRGFLADHLDGHRRGILVPDPNNARLMAPRALLLPLYQSLLEPVMALLETAHTVYIIPTGPLHYLPIAALTPDPNRTPPLLTGGRRIVYAPSATVLLNYCHTRTPSAQQGTLAVAPDDAQLRMIQGAAKALAQGKGKALIGSHATRQTFLAEAPHYRSICFLGHGYFDRRYAMSSRLQFSDGHLYASEILRDLRMQADLVVLAACETGRGQILRGDEILGLTRTMLYAGTPSVLVTLWPVHEIPTRLLVERLFAELTVQQEAGNGFDPAGALAKTQEWLRTLTFAEAQAQLHGWPDQADTETDRYLTALWQMTKSGIAPQSTDQLFNHPFFWSPYILVGDRPPNNHRQSS